jgi:hypothetical protein
MPELSVRFPRLQVHQQLVKVMSARQPRLLKTDFKTIAYDDYSNYKANHHSNNTIN